MRSSHAGFNITDYSLIKRYNIYDTKEGSPLVSSSELTQENNQQKHKSNTSECFNDLALLSKRKARTLLRIGNNTLNSLIDNGEIKVIRINNNDKISFSNLRDFILRKNQMKVSEEVPSKVIDEESSISNANNIINDILKEYR